MACAWTVHACACKAPPVLIAVVWYAQKDPMDPIASTDLAQGIALAMESASMEIARVITITWPQIAQYQPSAMMLAMPYACPTSVDLGVSSAKDSASH